VRSAASQSAQLSYARVRHELRQPRPAGYVVSVRPDACRPPWTPGCAASPSASMPASPLPIFCCRPGQPAAAPRTFACMSARRQPAPSSVSLCFYRSRQQRCRFRVNIVFGFLDRRAPSANCFAIRRVSQRSCTTPTRSLLICFQLATH
jgi:hypothetical protein